MSRDGGDPRSNVDPRVPGQNTSYADKVRHEQRQQRGADERRSSASSSPWPWARSYGGGSPSGVSAPPRRSFLDRLFGDTTREKLMTIGGIVVVGAAASVIARLEKPNTAGSSAEDEAPKPGPDSN